MRPICNSLRFSRAAQAAVIILVLSFVSTAIAQGIPPGTGRSGVSSSSANKANLVSLAASGKVAAGATAPPCTPAVHDFLPLVRTGTADADAIIRCFYNTTNSYAFATDVQYLYNPGGTANTISSTLTSMEFPGGLLLSLTGNASTGSCSHSSSTATGAVHAFATATNSNCGTSQNGGTTPSLQQDVQTVTQGGNFGLKGLWPILNARGKGVQLMSVAEPRMGFEVSGLSAQNTSTGATNVNGNFSSETYFQWDARGSSEGAESPGSIFADYRGGWEHVSSDFVKSAGLKSGPNFGLQQLSVGLVVNGFLRVSAQRYFGPEQAFVNSAGKTATVNNFNNWQLVVQLVPSTGKSKKTTGANTN